MPRRRPRLTATLPRRRRCATNEGFASLSLNGRALTQVAWQVLSVHPALQARVRTPAGAPSLSQDAQPPPKLPERPTAEPSLLKPTLDKSAEAAVVSTASWEEGKDYF